MTEPSKRSHEDKVHRDDLHDERVNPGENDFEFGAGANPADREGGKAARETPLDSTDGEQAGTQRDPRFKPEGSHSRG